MALFPVIAVALLLHAATGTAHALNMASPGCPSSCGNITIPYPFGIGSGCYLDGFNLTCNYSYQPPKLFLGDGTVELLDISLANATVRIDSVVQYDVTRGTGNGTWGRGLSRTAKGLYYLTEKRNRFVVRGCNMQAVLLDGRNDSNIVAACTTICALKNGRPDLSALAYESESSCSGVGCCQTPISVGLTSYDILLYSVARTMPTFFFSQSGMVYITDDEWFDGNTGKLGAQSNNPGDKPVVPAVLDWAIGESGCPKQGSNTACRSSRSFCRNSTGNAHGGYLCQCKAGYEGNPYITNGCHDVNECAHPENYRCYGDCINKPGSFMCQCSWGMHGDARTKHGCVPKGWCIGLQVSAMTLILPALAWGTIIIPYKLVRKSRARKLKAKFFKQNRGLLLQKLVDKDIAERMVFSLEELEKATNKFDEACMLGSGGHGTVYKGILSNQRVVAIKKSNITIQGEIDNFINEVAILSQINHRNVVQLLGCCLETQVPLLVYEFISNGTLSNHLHVEGPISLSLEDRLRIALETASALAYLHSSALILIIHRDVKSTNILLNDRLTTKISDFGASRGVSIDQAGVTIAIQGTLGYLDPEYYKTRRPTDKSDVYSFGVILMELLTRKKPTVFLSPGVSLVALFNLLMSQDKLSEILDPQVVLEGLDDAKVVAALAATCLSSKGEDRPTMRQVEIRLEGLIGSKKNIERHTLDQNYTSTQMSNGNSRKYSMEQEILLSASIPR